MAVSANAGHEATFSSRPFVFIRGSSLISVLSSDCTLIVGRDAPDHVELIFGWNYGLIAVRFKEAGVAKLADAPDLGSGPERGASSNLVLGITTLESGGYANFSLAYW